MRSPTQPTITFVTAPPSPATAPLPDLWWILLRKLRLDGPEEVGGATALNLAAVPHLNDGLVRLVKLTTRTGHRASAASGNSLLPLVYHSLTRTPHPHSSPSSHPHPHTHSKLTPHPHPTPTPHPHPQPHPHPHTHSNPTPTLTPTVMT